VPGCLSRPYPGRVLSLTDVARAQTALDPEEQAWLTALVGQWQLLADLSFADLVLWLPRADGSGFVVGAQMRPTTAPTAYTEDMVGRRLEAGRRPLVDGAFETGRIRRDGDPEWWDSVPVRVEAIPVVHRGRVVAVIARTTNLVAARTPSRLELVYLEAAGLLARMIADGRFPQTTDPTPARRGAPRVGDGLVRLDPAGLVTFASPNAMSAYRRLGLVGDLVGASLAQTTQDLQAEPSGATVDEAVQSLLTGTRPRLLEIASPSGVLAVRVIPLTPHDAHEGAIVLVRDVTDLRRREQQLLSKDATIREIHHRVKNNLQTVASLLRLQARRVADPAARTALEESVRRVGSIAVVHEMLAETADDDVDLDEVLGRLAGMVGDMATRDAAVTIRRRGVAGRVSSAVATPVSMAVAELLQNAIEHGLAGAGGQVALEVERDERRLAVVVEDTGVGLPEGFDIERTGSLGLRIVLTMVRDLGGTVALTSQTRGTRARIEVPLT
jgi:two-component sensor histidine kinase